MFARILTIARNTFTESIRQPIYLVVLVTVGLLLLMALGWAIYTLEEHEKLLIDMSLSMIFVGGLLLAAFTATGVLTQEIENKTVLTVISKPIGRSAFVVGKYLGVIGAIAVALWIWSLIFLLCVRHEVLATAADQVDAPVVVFGVGAVFLALLIALWGNYFYNWIFASRFTALLAAMLAVGYLLVLMIGPEWSFQPITHEFTKDDGFLVQVLKALFLIFMAVALLGAVAIACSTRLGQVMTLVVCLVIFLLGLSSDYVVGRFTEVQPLAWVGYVLIPNLGFSWLADALTLGNPISLQYVGMVMAYNVLYILAALALAVGLFQTRETG